MVTDPTFMLSFESSFDFSARSVSLGLFLYSYTRRAMLPFRMPMRAKIKDYNDLLPDGKTIASEATIEEVTQGIPLAIIDYQITYEPDADE